MTKETRQTLIKTSESSQLSIAQTSELQEDQKDTIDIIIDLIAGEEENENE